MSFLEDFQASLEPLPNILQRKYALLRDLDKSLHDIQRQNEQRCLQEIEEFKEGVKSGNIGPGSSLSKFSDEAQDEQKHAIRIADEKVALAVQAYDLVHSDNLFILVVVFKKCRSLVDAHIQQLDQYLRKLEEQRREKENAAAAGSTALNSDSNGKPVIQSGRGGRKKSRLAAAASTATTTTANPSGMDLDLPVDPNEPTYCHCNQVSYGEMVACDNPDCKIEWFHYGCVGLKEQPKGKCCGCGALSAHMRNPDDLCHEKAVAVITMILLMLLWTLSRREKKLSYLRWRSYTNLNHEHLSKDLLLPDYEHNTFWKEMQLLNYRHKIDLLRKSCVQADCSQELLNEVFQQFEIPSHMLRASTINNPQYDLYHLQYMEKTHKEEWTVWLPIA
ncbi:PHD finger protein ING1 [Tanacetum coccineum]